MNNDFMNDSQGNHNHVQHGSVRVQFRGQHQPICGIGYRFQTPDGKVVEGNTDKQGYTKTLIGDNANVGQESDLLSYTNLNGNNLLLALEVQRDDGTWKKIGNFQLEAGKDKEITAQIETTALPFTLVPVEK